MCSPFCTSGSHDGPDRQARPSHCIGEQTTVRRRHQRLRHRRDRSSACVWSIEALSRDARASTGGTLASRAAVREFRAGSARAPTEVPPPVFLPQALQQALQQARQRFQQPLRRRAFCNGPLRNGIYWNGRYRGVNFFFGRCRIEPVGQVEGQGRQVHL